MLLPDWLLAFLSSSISLQLHCLPLTAGIQLKVLVLVLKSKLGIAPKYLTNHIRSPLSSVFHRSIRSVVRHTLFVPRVRTTMAQTRSFATIGPSSQRCYYSTAISLLKTFFVS